jgi:hypothetical protein
MVVFKALLKHYVRSTVNANMHMCPSSCCQSIHTPTENTCAYHFSNGHPEYRTLVEVGFTISSYTTTSNTNVHLTSIYDENEHRATRVRSTTGFS